MRGFALPPQSRLRHWRRLRGEQTPEVVATPGGGSGNSSAVVTPPLADAERALSTVASQNVLRPSRWRVGQLRREASGAIDFQYAAGWLAWESTFPISLSLPLREDRYIGTPVMAVFDNLLPDNLS